MKEVLFYLIEKNGQAKSSNVVRIEFDDGDHWGYLLNYNGEQLEDGLILGIVQKNNNRGITIYNHSLTGRKTELFYSRGDWHILTPEELCASFPELYTKYVK